MVNVVSSISGDLTLLLSCRVSLDLPDEHDVGERISGLIGSGNWAKLSMDWLTVGPFQVKTLIRKVQVGNALVCHLLSYYITYCWVGDWLLDGLLTWAVSSGCRQRMWLAMECKNNVSLFILHYTYLENNKETPSGASVIHSKGS